VTEVQSQVLHSFSKVKGGRTVLDVVEDTGLSDWRVREAIKELLRAEKLVDLGARFSDGLGHTQRVKPPKVYRAVEEL
jgi:hypothetical protein